MTDTVQIDELIGQTIEGAQLTIEESGQQTITLMLGDGSWFRIVASAENGAPAYLDIEASD